MKESQLMNITEKIKALDDQVTSSRSQRNELNKEAKKLAESRNEFNVKFKKLRDEIGSYVNCRLI